jgi:uncharacterized OsmC-like protein
MSTAETTTVPFTVTAEGDGVAQRVSVGGGHPHEFATDTYPAFGGADAAPSPLSYVLGALTSCNQVVGSIVARELGVSLGTWSFDVQGDLDPSVLATGAEGNANFTRITLRATIETDADDATFARLQSETERRCPVTQMVVRSGVDYTSAWSARPLPA